MTDQTKRTGAISGDVLDKINETTMLILGELSKSLGFTLTPNDAATDPTPQASEVDAFMGVMQVSRNMYLAARATGFTEREACHVVGVFMAEVTQGGQKEDKA